jgi:hypothetical protein
MRAAWSKLTDAQLLSQCEIDTYRASGPGGQKRNKTSSAVRLRHSPSGLIVIAEESRSQHENKARALGRLRRAIYLKIRDQIPASRLKTETLAEIPEFSSARDGDGRLGVRRKDPRFWPAAGVILDVLDATGARTSEAAALLGISTANLVDFLQRDPKLWEQANVMRAQFGHKLLHQ